MKTEDQVCLLCPRACAASRTPGDPGWCGADEGFQDYRLSSLMPHHGEESFISGYAGSGTIFFTGCSLKCCFCQNYEISHEGQGRRLSPQALLEKIESLLERGVHNLNLVTPSHYADRLPQLFERLKRRAIWQSRPVPLIWNSSAYESLDSLRHIAPMVDVYLADMKFFDPLLSQDLAAAPDYAQLALQALEEMQGQQPRPLFDSRGLIRRGLVIRHLILPGHSQDSIRILDQLADFIALDTPLSLMRQYRPRSAQACPKRPVLQRRLTREEYQEVLSHARVLGFSHILTQ